jgi:hypothetical protein
MSVKLECACLKGSLELGDELTAKDTAEHFDRKREGSVSRSNGSDRELDRQRRARNEHEGDVAVTGLRYGAR